MTSGPSDLLGESPRPPILAALELDAEPDAVPTARRLVRSSLAEVASDLVDDAELVMSELVANAVFHGVAPIQVRILFGERVRIEIEDAGGTWPVILRENREAMTGRGLSLVSSLATWGVDRRPVGKVVWAEISSFGVPQTEPRGPRDLDELLASWSDHDAEVPTFTVRLGGVPTDLLLAAKSHIDDVVREAILIQAGEEGRGRALSAEMASLVETVAKDFADARAEIKRQAVAAAAHGEAITNLELRLPLTAADAGERYLAALDRADRYARANRFLTLAAPRTHQLFRQWYVQSLIGQLRASARGDQAPELRPFEIVLTEEVANLAEQAESASRLFLLQRAATELAGADTVREIAEIVAGRAVEFLGVKSAQIRLIDEDDLLRTVAHRGETAPATGRFDAYPLDADLPGAEAVRHRVPIFVPSILEREPSLVGQLPEDSSAHVVPLVAGDQVLGVLSLTFRTGELTTESERTVVSSLADMAAQALERAELSERDRLTRETLSLLADATQIMINDTDPAEVLRRLVTLAVPRLGDWCTVFVAQGGGLRRAAMAIDGHPDLAEHLLATHAEVLPDSPASKAFVTGVPQTYPSMADGLLERLYPGLDLDQLGSDVRHSSGLCVPIRLRNERIGVIGLAFIASGRHLTDQVVEALSGLADRAALAFDRARTWSAQRAVVQTLVSALLPDAPAALDGVTVAARYLPAGSDVAGDWWDVRQLPDRSLLIGLGDAAGHGVDAVSMMSELRHGARALALHEDSPAAILTVLDRYLSAPDDYATAVYGRLEPDTGLLRWASAGHLPPLLWRPHGGLRLLTATDVPLGISSPRGRSDHEMVLSTGDTLILYSDGLVERRDAAIDEGIRRLSETVGDYSGDDLEEMADRIFVPLCSEAFDDCCLLLVRYG